MDASRDCAASETGYLIVFQGAAVYQRPRYGDEARHALEAWDAHVAAIVKGEASPSNVVPLVG